MDKFTVDFTNLDKKINGKKVYKLSDVNHIIRKVAFDVVRFTQNEDTEKLWKIEDSADGPVIVAMYDDDSEGLTVTASDKTFTDWKVIADGDSADEALTAAGYDRASLVRLADAAWITAFMHSNGSNGWELPST